LTLSASFIYFEVINILYAKKRNLTTMRIENLHSGDHSYRSSDKIKETKNFVKHFAKLKDEQDLSGLSGKKEENPVLYNRLVNFERRIQMPEIPHSIETTSPYPIDNEISDLLVNASSTNYREFKGYKERIDRYNGNTQEKQSAKEAICNFAKALEKWDGNIDNEEFINNQEILEHAEGIS
jgi:hypothetical protein